MIIRSRLAAVHRDAMDKDERAKGPPKVPRVRVTMSCQSRDIESDHLVERNGR